MMGNDVTQPIVRLILWDGPIDITDAEAVALTKVREQLLDAIDNDKSPLFPIITSIVELILTGIQMFTQPPVNFIAKVTEKFVKRKRAKHIESQRIRRATIEVLIRLLRPDLGYTMEISDVRLVCREVWGGEHFSSAIPDAIYDKVRFSLEGGRLWEYCSRKGLGRYLQEKHRQVDFSYILYQNGSILKRLLQTK